MWRVAIYARAVPGRSGRTKLDRQVGRLVAQAARQPSWHHVATYADQSSGGWWVRPGLSRLLADAPVYFDVVLVDGCGRLTPNRRELAAILGHLRAAGVTTIVLRPTAGRRLVKAMANFALADVLDEALS